MPSNRRRFLQQAALLPAALGAAAGAQAAPASAPRPTSALKLSLNAFSFNDALVAGLSGRPGGVALADVLEFCAQHDIAAIDPTGYYFPGYPAVPARDFVHDFKRRAFRLGIGISGTGIRNDFAQPDPAKRAADVQRALAWIETAADLGAPVIRVFAGAVPPGYEQRWDEAAAWMIDALGQCVEHGRKHGVVVGVQNHGDMLKSADECLKIVRAINSPWFGLIVDTGNMLVADPYADLARVVPHAVNWQVKESIFNNDPARPVDVPRLVRLIRDGGYRGYVPIETLAVKGRPYDPFAIVPPFAATVRAALDQA